LSKETLAISPQT